MKKRPSLYLRTLTIAFVSLSVLIVLFNYFMDPYAVFGREGVEGINQTKPMATRHQYLIKAEAVHRMKPEAIILGSSRGETGLDTRHPGFANMTAYNLSLVSADIHSMLKYFQHAQHEGKLRTVVLTLDFFAFNAMRPMNKEFDPSILHVPGISSSAYRFRRMKHLTSTLISLGTLIDSAKTLMDQRHGEISALDFRTGMLEGKALAFAPVLEGYMTRNWLDKTHHVFRFENKSSGRSSWKDFYALLDSCYRDDISLFMIISPAHAYLLEGISAVGLWPEYEMWQRDMVRMNEALARQYKRKPFPLWNFSGYNDITTEEVKDLDKRDANLQWYWEVTHYKRRLGDLMLDRIFDFEPDDHAKNPDVGVLLHSANLENHFSDIRLKQAGFREKNHEQIRRIEDMRNHIFRKLKLQLPSEHHEK